MESNTKDATSPTDCLPNGQSAARSLYCYSIDCRQSTDRLLPALDGQGLFVFSDPGGAKPILSYVLLSRMSGKANIISDRRYDFFADFQLDVELCPSNIARSQAALSQYAFDRLEMIKPSFVFTGTSYTSSIELEFIEMASGMGIPTYSFIDHYTNLLDRFRRRAYLHGLVVADAGYPTGSDQSPDELILPNNLCMIDSKAEHLMSRALADCHLPSGRTPRVLVTGNYYHRFLHLWKPIVSKWEFYQQLELQGDERLVVFAPDPLSNVGGSGVYGFDERDVWLCLQRALHSIMEELSLSDSRISSTPHVRPFSVVVVMHPNQRRELLLHHLQENDSLRVIVRDKEHLNTLLAYSHVTVGMFSSILIEGQLLGCEIIRCLIGFTGASSGIQDPFAGMDGMAIASSHEELTVCLRRCLL